MCGIIGIVGTEPQRYIKALNDRIAHRGPDDEGFFNHHRVALAHKRLSIIDLSANGHQPMLSADGQYVIIFNGEIYNHLDIREKLKHKYTFKSTSDTETLLYGYIEFGKDILNMMNGIFAFSIYDIQKEELFIARDQLGIKPLYYYYKDDVLLFGSEIKSFLDFPSFDRTINYNALVNYLDFLWSPGELTPFIEVKKLLPGHCIQLNANNLASLKIEKYYDIPYTGEYPYSSEKEAISLVENALFKAVERQLLSDVPVAFFLSGGLDSSAIVAMAKKIRPNERLRCYTIKTSDSVGDEGFSDDLYYARLVAKELDLDLIEVEAKIDIIADFDKMIYHLDEPQADAAPLNVLNICAQARKDGYKVLLGGTAGDDLFSGYRRHQALNYEKYFKWIPRPLGKFLKSASEKLDAKNPINRRVRKLVANLDLTKINRMFGYFEWLPLSVNKSLFNRSIQKKIENYQPSKYFFDLLKNIPNEKNDLNKMLYWELRTFLVDHNLNYTDKLSMATGVEVRVPFLDMELLELSTKIAPGLKMKGTTTKYILKKVMEKYLPYEVIYRSKAGFGAPVRQWITTNLDDKINDYLSESSILKRNIFEPSTVRQLIADNKSGKIDASYSIWCLLAIESWFRQYVDLEQNYTAKK